MYNDDTSLKISDKGVFDRTVLSSRISLKKCIFIYTV